MSEAYNPSTLSSSLPIMKQKSSLVVMHDSAKPTTEYSVFYSKQDKTLIEIKLPETVQTIRELIQISLSELILTHFLELPNKPDEFKIYAAKKTGKKKSDLPCLDNSQKVQKTKINFFCLERKEAPKAVINPEQPPVRTSKGLPKKEKSTMLAGYDPLASKNVPSAKEIPPKKQGAGCFGWCSEKC